MTASRNSDNQTTGTLVVLSPTILSIDTTTNGGRRSKMVFFLSLSRKTTNDVLPFFHFFSTRREGRIYP